jgi:hypothetical protein
MEPRRIRPLKFPMSRLLPADTYPNEQSDEAAIVVGRLDRCLRKMRCGRSDEAAAARTKGEFKPPSK